MRPPRVLRTTIFRLAAVYAAGFAAAVAILGVVVYFVTAGLMVRRLDARVESEATALVATYRSGGLDALTRTLSRHEEARPSGVRGYAVLTDGRRAAGHLQRWPQTPGWSTLPNPDPDAESASHRYFVTDLADGVRLVVAADQERIEDAKEAIFDGFMSAFGAVLILGIAGGLGLSYALLRRVEAIRRTAQAIIAGDLTQRIPVRGTGDDFDRLSQTLNQMLDRIGELMASLREVSANIAHDLKTPLARLRRRLEAAQAQPDGLALEEAIGQADEILATFDALLRIAQIEAGTRRSGFAPLDLSVIFATVAEAFAPAAEDAGQSLTASIAPGITFTGDRELLTQMLANTIDNAIRHNGAGTHITLSLNRDASGIIGIVSDDGRGVPASGRTRIFDRFHRLPQSDGVAGSGLGLSLAKAVADLHGMTLVAEDAAPGLRLSMRFPEPPGRVRPCFA